MVPPATPYGKTVPPFLPVSTIHLNPHTAALPPRAAGQGSGVPAYQVDVRSPIKCLLPAVPLLLLLLISEESAVARSSAGSSTRIFFRVLPHANYYIHNDIVTACQAFVDKAAAVRLPVSHLARPFPLRTHSAPPACALRLMLRRASHLYLNPATQHLLCQAVATVLSPRHWRLKSFLRIDLANCSCESFLRIRAKAARRRLGPGQRAAAAAAAAAAACRRATSLGRASWTRRKRWC